MIGRLAQRFFSIPEKRLLWKFGVNFGWKSMLSVRRFQKRLKRGIHFPAFFFVSVTNACNLSCQGCWISPTTPPRELPADVLRNIIRQAAEQGCSFFGILGGEPLMYEPLFDVLEEFPNCYFLVFTNGTLITDEVAERMRRLGNVSPLVSIEGSPVVSDGRRGGKNVYARTLAGLECCTRARLITGVASSVCRSNLDDLVSDAFIEEMMARKVLYLWYYLYRPVGPEPAPELALSPEQVVRMRHFLVEARCRHPMLLVDAYWDHDGNALCPAAVGIGHHVNPWGDIEPCPPLQAAADRVSDGDLYSVVTASAFLKAFRERTCSTTRGCIIMENPVELNALLDECGARDTTGRGTLRRELAAMCPHTSHAAPGPPIPEKHWVYRFAKRHWFFGFGAYG